MAPLSVGQGGSCFGTSNQSDSNYEFGNQFDEDKPLYEYNSVRESEKMKGKGNVESYNESILQ